MVSAVQIFVSLPLLYFGLKTPGNFLPSNGLISPSLLTEVALIVSIIVITSFILTRILSWILSQ